MIVAKEFLRDQQILSSPSAPAQPTVSVILPTYRRCKDGLLERSLRSVLGQTYRDFELLVMDDGSTDGSAELIGRLRQSDPRIIHVRHDLNSGLPALRVNEGIALAKGQYIAFQFDDDVWRPDALQILTAAARSSPELALVIGQAQVHNTTGRVVIPEGPVGLVNLAQQNRFANNSVLVPRPVFARNGMYDMHIGMRRLTDWDLWLRLIQEIPFLAAEKVVADVYEFTAGAIGLTTPFDLDLFSFIHSIPRNELLTLDTWLDYPVDGLQIGAVSLPGEFRRRVYEEQIVPFYYKRRHAFPHLGGFTATLNGESRPKTLLYTQQSYEVSNEVALKRYDELSNARGSFKGFYQTLSEVHPGWSSQVDLGLLIRTVQDEALEMLSEAERTGRPLGLYLDDDLFTFHEYGPQFNYIAPGTRYYETLAQVAAHADATLVTNEYLGESVRAFTPRVVPHNGALPDDALPQALRPRGTPLRIAYVGSNYRIDEFRAIWDALLRISKEYGDRVEFEFWGLDISSLPRLASPTTTRPYTFSYPLYLRSLQEAGFDILLIPLFESPRPRLAKALIKYYETAAACSLGIFSDVVQYRALPADLTCLKVANDAQSWYDGLKRAIEMPEAEFDLLRRRCIEHVREEYTTSAQIDLHEAALRAIEFHGRTRSQRAADGRPRVLYVMHSVHYAGAEIQLMRRWRIAQRYGLQPVVMVPAVLKDTEQGQKFKSALALEGISLETAVYSCFTEPRSPAEHNNELERNQIKQVIERVRPALVHSITFIPSLGQVCQELGLPLVSTLYQVDHDFTWSGGRPDFRHCAIVQSDSLRYASRWADLLGVPKIAGRIGNQGSFDIGQRRYLQALQADGTLRPAPLSPRPLMLVMGTFQPRKQQLETIRAAAVLKKEGYSFEIHMYGYTKFYPDYMEQCYQAIQQGSLENSIIIHDFVDDEDSLLAKADMLLSLSNFESFPGSIQGALAAGVLVVATPAGGVAEMITDHETGILCPGMDVDAQIDGLRRALKLTAAGRSRIVEQGRRVARLELHPLRAANDLFRMYNLALDETGRARPAAVQPAVSTVVIPDKSLTDRGRVRQPPGHPLSLMPLGAGLTYTVQADFDSWMGVDFLVELFTYPVPGVLELNVFTLAGGLLRQVSLDAATLKAGGYWCEFRFDQPVQNAAGQVFRLELTLRGAGGAGVSVRQSSPPIRRELRLLNRGLRKLGLRLKGGVPHVRMWYAR